MAHEDLLGGVAVTPPNGMYDAVSAGVERADGEEQNPEELAAVKTLWEEYTAAREFEKFWRRQCMRDRKYAAGLNDITWASDANMIGAIVDILVSYLYAKDPKYAARQARRVVAKTPLDQISPLNPAMLGPQLAPPMPGAAPITPGPMMPAPSAGGMAPVPGMPGAVPAPAPNAAQLPSQDALDSEAFADTLELVVNRLWRDAKLKRTARRWVRSALSVGVGWFKALFFTETGQDPQIASQLRDLKDSLESLQGLQKELKYDGFASPEARDQKIFEIQQTIDGMGPKLEKVLRQGLHIDFIPAEQVTVWLDVAATEDYLQAGALAEDIYIPHSQLCTRFPRLSDDEIKAASCYYQRKTSNEDFANMSPDSEGGSEGQYTKSTPDNGSAGYKKSAAYAKVVEVWDRRDGRIKTMVDGVKRWAVEPYNPPQATTRFYSYFRLAFYEVDGQRHPQSLSWRLHKLQDEYSAARSNQRLTRERSVPGVIFNEGELDKDQVRKLTDSVHQEYVGLKPTDPGVPMDKLLFNKTVGAYDPRIFDTTPIVADMAKVSGVQEPQQGAANPEITATQAQIEQSGFRSRTGTDRDSEEEVLNDFAQYCTECSIQALRPDYVNRIAGPAAFWPVGMDVQDILTLVEVDIEAGSTGKPGGDASREAWATLMPQIKETMLAVRQFDVTDPPLAEALRNFLRETIRRLDDRINIDQFIPPASVPPLMPQMPAAPEAAPGAGTPKKASGGPPPGAPMMP